jgi:hypothetical protein
MTASCRPMYDCDPVAGGCSGNCGYVCCASSMAMCVDMCSPKVCIPLGVYLAHDQVEEGVVQYMLRRGSCK